MFFDFVKFFISYLPSKLTDVLTEGLNIERYNSSAIQYFLKQNKIDTEQLLQTLDDIQSQWRTNIYRLSLLQHKTVFDKFMDSDVPELLAEYQAEDGDSIAIVNRRLNIIYLKTYSANWQLYSAYKILNDISFLATVSDSDTLEVYYSTYIPTKLASSVFKSQFCIVNYIRQLLKQVEDKPIYTEFVKALCMVICEIYSLLISKRYCELYRLLVATHTVGSDLDIQIHGTTYHMPIYIPFYCNESTGKQIIKGFTVNSNPELNMYWRIMFTANKIVYTAMLPYDINKPNVLYSLLLKRLVQLKYELCSA